jgi:excisionase family DNA binding protein
MHRRLQFGMRENPASDRRHGSRQAVCSRSDADLLEEKATTPTPQEWDQNHPFANGESRPNAASPCAATSEPRESANAGDPITVALGRSQKATLGFEPLIGTPEAAKLLGNIHVKTLQRYARHQRIPGYQIGGHWYFRASELDAWLRSRINSSCHPCRSNQEAK